MGSTHLPPTFDPREEPGALAAHAGICAGGEERSSSLPRPEQLQVALRDDTQVVIENLGLNFVPTSEE